jgi:hypothetical protein
VSGYQVADLLADALRDGDEEAVSAIGRVITRKASEPAILVTLGGKRYVVATEDEHVFDRIPDGPHSLDSYRFQVFGAQWLRGYGRVDEMYRSLSLCEVTKVQRVDRARVWGDR